MHATIHDLLARMAHQGASDLHLTTPGPPVFRIDDQLRAQTGLPALKPEDVEQIFTAITSAEQQAAFMRDMDLDFAYSVPGLARFRVNAMRQRGSLSLAFRLVPFKTPTIDELGLPPILKQLVEKPRGLILVTGSAGSGKSTTLAAMINHLNATTHRNIITIEDPIEYLFHNDQCIIRQRELGCDTRSFAAALTHALRHDPDVIVIGELRDLSTISNALTAAETGHLVIGTLHTIDAAQSIDRIVDMFPAAQQKQVRSQLAQVIEAVLAQMLVPRAGGGRALAMEIMLTSPVIRAFIREGKTSEITGNLEMGASEGKQSINQALAALVKAQQITREEAVRASSDPARLGELLDPGARFRIGA
jgi:twitching motility protein PilT